MRRPGVSAGLMLLVALGGCGDGVGDDDAIDPSNPIALSRVLEVDGARRRTGLPPSPSAGADAPSLTASSTAAVVQGRRFAVELEFTPGEEDDGPRRVFFGVEGARDHFVLDAAEPLRFSVLVPSQVSEGRFRFHVCADDQSGRVSNAVVLGIDVTPPIVQRDDGFFCTTGGESACEGRGLQFCIEPESRDCFYLIGGEVVGCTCSEGSPNPACTERVVELCAP